MDEAAREILESQREMIMVLARLETLNIDPGAEAPRVSASQVARGNEIIVPLTGAVDFAAEVARLDKELGKLDKEHAMLSGKLANENYVTKAPAQVVERDRARVLELADARTKLLALRDRFQDIDRVAEYTFEMADELEHAWAITVHKSQGSEFMAVIMPLISYHRNLCYRNLLYTGVTRARRLLIILGQPETLFKMAANHKKTLRYTNLKEMLLEELTADS